MRRARVVRFQEELPEGGRSKPLLVEAIDDKREHVDLVVKLVSHVVTLDARRLVREAVATAMAAKLGLPIPESFSAELTENFIRSIELSDRHIGHRLREHVNLTGPMAFGSTYVPGLEVVSPNMSLSEDLKPAAAEIFSFDALTLNRDRCIPAVGNPNCLTNGSRFVIIDHEQSLDGDALGYGDAQEPWRHQSLDGMRGLLEHIFMFGLRGYNPDLERLENAWSRFTQKDHEDFFNGIPREWDSDRSEKAKILNYLQDLGRNLPAAFTEIRRVLA